jgi:hypothetical protein
MFKIKKYSVEWWAKKVNKPVAEIYPVLIVLHIFSIVGRTTSSKEKFYPLVSVKIICKKLLENS